MLLTGVARYLPRIASSNLADGLSEFILLLGLFAMSLREPARCMCLEKLLSNLA